MIRLLICDDHAIVRQGLRQVLADADDLCVVGEASDGVQALRRIRGGGVDVVLLDIALPGRDGFDVLRQARHEFPALPVLIVSTYPEEQYALRCLRMGAAGYLNKTADPSMLIAAIRKVARGGLFVGPATAEELAGLMRRDMERPRHDRLSSREFQVFTMIASGKSVSQIADALALSANTVSTYRARIMQKIGTHNDVETALYAVHHRLVLAAGYG